jgi:hypothetical protein
MANKYEATGTLFEIFPALKLSDKFTKREFILEVLEGRYPEFIKFQLINDKCDLIEPFQKGQAVTISFNLKGKPVQDRNGNTQFYTNLDCWRVQAASATDNTNQEPDPAFFNQSPVNDGYGSSQDMDDLPF